MKAVEPHLYIRNGHFYYRSAIPRTIQPFLGLRENVIALRVTDKRVARSLAAQINLAEQGIWHNIADAHNTASSDEFEAFTSGILERLAEIKQIARPSMPLFTQGTPEPKKRPLAPLPSFSEIAQKYMADCLMDAPRTKQQKESTLTLFQDLTGDMPFQSIKIEQAIIFKEALLKMPPHAKKRLRIKDFKDFKDFNIDDITDGSTLNHKTINGRLATLRALFNWAEKRGYYSSKNPFSSLTIKGRASQRTPFKPHELSTLFSSPIYTGCKGLKWTARLEEGTEIFQDALYWIPMIALYSGMRLNEICQMTLTDIRQEDGIWVFDVNDSDEKRLKTASSARRIPIHSTLMNAGFLEYWKNLQQEKAPRLFPDLTEGVNNSLSAPFSKRFRRLLDTLAIKRKGLCFHSLRHTFVDGLRNAAVEKALAMRLTGHQAVDIHDRYGAGYSLKIQQNAIEKINFSIR